MTREDILRCKRRWTDKELSLFKEYYQSNKDIFKLSKILKRSIFSLRKKAERLRIKRPVNTWSNKEINYLKKNYGKIGLRDLCINLSRTKSSIHAKAHILRLKSFYREDLHGNWKGDDVGLAGVHQWVKKYKPKTKLCEYCNKNKFYDLANISGKYKRDIKDYKWLCRGCHMRQDGRINNLKQYRGGD